MNQGPKTDCASDSGQNARIPEHSISMMLAMSGGNSFDIGNYRFYHGNDWLAAIGYPLRGPYKVADFEQALEKAAEKAAATSCFCIAPELPGKLRKHRIEQDRFYLLSASAGVPPRLRNAVKRAAALLKVEESPSFTPEHRRLWGEFLAANAGQMKPRVMELYARTPGALAQAGQSLRLLDARDADGNVVASLLLDHAPANFISYIIGAHSRKNYAPHATDLLFAKMIELARRENKRFIHLGLGVNEGILRFKRKWGALPGQSFEMAQWERENEESASLALARAILNAPQVSRAQFLANEPQERPFAMLWRLEKNGRISWIGGTAHFFCHSFQGSFQSLFDKVENVIFEGPLDPDFMREVEAAGKNPPAGYVPLLDEMTEAEVGALERTVKGPSGMAARLMGLEKPSRADVRWLLANGLPWYAFFTLWTAFLERLGWKQSVDMEAWHIARDMGKNVIGMETLEEQLESLGSLPRQRALNFFRACGSWKNRARQNMKAYLAGDLEKMMGSSAEFPTRTEHIVGRRDQRFRERMRPYLEKGGAAVFVGCAHMVNLRHMLREDGFDVRQQPFGLWPKLHRQWRGFVRLDREVAW